MDSRQIDRVGLVAAGVAWMSIGVIEVLGAPDARARPLWWALWLAFGAAYGLVQVGPDQPASAGFGRRRRVVLLAVVPLGVAVVLYSQLQGFSGVALVMSAVLLGRYLPPLPAIGWIVGQTAAVVVPPLVASGTGALAGAVATGLAFLAFQLFAFLMVVALRDVENAKAAADAARAQAEAVTAALREAQSRLAETSRTQERLRIARDLHDTVGHQLTALSVQLQVASRLASGEARSAVEACRSVAADLLRDVRAVVGQLREPAAGAPPLPAALEALAASVPRPVVHLDVDPDLPDLPPEQVEVLRRCVQEVLTNAVRHSGADNVWVAVEELAGVATVTARDDGRGSAAVTPGHGLTGMAERFAAHGGTVAWHGIPGQGFRLQASLPVKVGAT